MVKQGDIFKPTDKRRTNRRIRVKAVRCVSREPCFIAVESRLVGQRTWKPAPAIRLDRLESRHYKLVRK